MDIKDREAAAERMITFCRKEGLPDAAVGALSLFFVRFGMTLGLTPVETVKLFVVMGAWAKASAPKTPGLEGLDLAELVERAERECAPPGTGAATDGSMN